VSGGQQALERPEPGSIRIERLSSPEAAANDWDALARAGGNIFATREWVSAWARHSSPSLRPLLFACRSGDRLLALLPLHLWASRPLRVARFLGHGPADELGPVCAPSDRRRALAGLPEVCAAARLDLLLAELLPGGESWEAPPGRKLIHRESSPILSLEGGWEAYLGARSANFRQQVGRRERRLAREHALQFRLTTDAAELDSDLSLLFSLHRARWGDTSPFARWEGFHRDFARVALERGWLRLWFLELDGRPAAAWYGFRFGSVESYYQAGRDPEMGAGSVGFVLLAHSIREASKDGMQEYRFLRGGETYKSRFASDDHGLETVVFTRGLPGKVAAAAAAVGVRSGPLAVGVRRLAAAVGR
jgi:CelD/BcsL family acetyltransferase involved in cellulose biosynthesis